MWNISNLETSNMPKCINIHKEFGTTGKTLTALLCRVTAISMKPDWSASA